MSDYSRLSPRSFLSSAPPQSPTQRASSGRRRVNIVTRSRSIPKDIPTHALIMVPSGRASPTPVSDRRRGSSLSVPRFEPPYGPLAIERSHRQMRRCYSANSLCSTPKSEAPTPKSVEVIPVSTHRRLVPKPIKPEREPGVIKVSQVRHVPPQHVERMPFDIPRYDPVPSERHGVKARSRKGRRRTGPSLLERIREFWKGVIYPEQQEDQEVTLREANLAAKIDRLPLLPVVLKRNLFDVVDFLHNLFASRAIFVVFAAILLAVLTYSQMGSVLPKIPLISQFSRMTSGMFVAIDTEEIDRPGLSFYEKFNSGSSELPHRHPVVIFPGFITTGLEIWEAKSPCLKKLKLNPSLRAWMLGPSMILLMLRDTACWLYLFSLDPETGLDRDGIRIRGGEGAAAVGEFVPGFWVWEKVIRNLADIGYDPSNIAVATYDWRLSPDLMQKRDGFYHRTKHLILQLYEQHQRPVAIIGHSYAITVMVPFLQWAEVEEKGFLNKYISHIVNVGGIALGAPKTLSATLFGDVQDTLTVPYVLRRVLDRVMEPSLRYNFARTWSCLLAMLPHPCLEYDGGILEDENHGSQLSTTEALRQLQSECLRTGHTNCVRKVVAHLQTATTTLPSLPKAPRTTMFCLYGVNKSTEVGYYITQSENITVTLNAAASHRGVKKGNGDGTVPLASLAYMCRAPNGWKKNLGKVITTEFPHDTSKASLLDFRGGRSSADHVDILGNYEALEMVLRIVSGVDETLKGGSRIQDRVFSNVDDLLQAPFTEKCRKL